MAFPEGWPPRPAYDRRSIRVFIEGTGTADFADNAFLFSSVIGANTITPTPVVTGPAAVVNFGDNTQSGSPMGGRRVYQDAMYMGIPIGESPVPMLWAQTIRVVNTDPANALEISFDGVNVHGRVLKDREIVYRNRYEAGISVRGIASYFIEAW